MTAPGGDTIIVGSVGVEVVADAKRFARSLKREVENAFRGAGQALQKTLQDATRDTKVKVRVEPEFDQAAFDRAVAARRVRPIRIPVEPDRSTAMRAGRQASTQATRAAGPIRLRADVDRGSINRVLGVIGTAVRAAVVTVGGLAAIAAIGSGASAALAGIASAAAGLIPILGQLVSVAVTAAGALAAIPGALAIAGAGIGALIVGSSGIGDALKEAGTAAGGAGGAATDMGRQMERASRQVVLARRGISDATRQVTLAERGLADAQREARRAQEDLNRARAEARENLEDLELALGRARLDEEAAIRDVAEAEEQLNRVRASDFATTDEIEEADLAYRESLQTLAEVRDRLEDVGAEQADAAKKGVDNADVVVAAREREVEAARSVEQAQYDLRRSQRDLQDAYYNLTQAQLDLAEAQQAGAASGGGVASAMSKLAPAARELVNTLLALKPAWDALRLDVQQALWVGVAAEIRNLADAQLPVLRRGLVDVATVLNGAMKDGLRELATRSSQLRLAQIFTSARDALAGLSAAVRPMIRALLDLTAVGAQVIADLAGPAGQVLTDFADRISEMADSGELRQLILDGLEAVKLLGSALLDIVGIFRGIFQAAGEAGGGGIFGFLDRLNVLINSVAGQEALTNLFAELGRIGTALMPVLLALGNGLGVVAKAIGDIAVGTAPFLADFLTLLADALASLAPGFIALGPSVVALGKALIPLGQILADLVIGLAPGVEAFLSALGEGLEALAPAAKPVGEALAAILQAVAPLLPLLGAVLANALTEIAIVLQGLAEPIGAVVELFAALAVEFHREFLPILLQLGQQLLPVFAEAGRKILETFQPLIPVIADLAREMAGQLAAALPGLVRAFDRLVSALLSMDHAVWQAFVDAAIQLAPQLPQLVDAGLQLAVALADLAVALVPLIPLVTDLLLLVLRLVVPTSVAALTVLIHAMAGSLRAAIAPVKLAAGAVRTFGNVVSAVRNEVSDRLQGVLNLFRDLPDRIKRAVGDLGRLLLQAGKDVIAGLTRGIREALPNAADVAKDIGSTILDSAKGVLGIDSPSRVFADVVGREIPAGIAMGIQGNVGAATRAVDDVAAGMAARFDPLASLGPLATAPFSPPAPGASGDVNVNLTALSDQFNLQQVMDDLAFRGAV